MSGPFEGCEERAAIRVVMKDGTVLRGSYTTRAGMHFIHMTGPGFPLVGAVEGPLTEDNVASVEIRKTRDQVLEETRERLLGERFPGREPVTRDDFEHRLRAIAKAIAQIDMENGVLDRWAQLSRQFDQLSDRIGLAAPKREWLMREAKWSLRSNQEPRLRDLWVADVASPSMLRRPRPQDFEPDPVLRRRRDPVPEHVANDHRSIPNVLSRLRAAGFKARIDRLGDPPWDVGHVLVDLRHLAGGRRALVSLQGERLHDGYMDWKDVCDCGSSPTGLRRQRRIQAHDEYITMWMVLMGGGPNPVQEKDYAQNKKIPTTAVQGTLL